MDSFDKAILWLLIATAALCVFGLIKESINESKRAELCEKRGGVWVDNCKSRGRCWNPEAFK